MSSASGTRGALATLYFASTLSPCPYTLVLLDWSLQPIGSALPTYLSNVFARMGSLCRTVVDPQHRCLYAEPAGPGKVVLVQAHTTGEYDVRSVREDIAELKLEDRAPAGLVGVHSGEVKITTLAFERTVTFRGTAANHLRRQIAQYTPDQRADDAELLTAWLTGILMAMEAPSRR